jgi:hypothetical protein
VGADFYVPSDKPQHSAAKVTSLTRDRNKAQYSMIMRENLVGAVGIQLKAARYTPGTRHL